MRRLLAPAAIFLVLAAASATAGTSPIKVVPAIPGGTTFKCTGAPTKLFDNTNGQGVGNGGKPATFSTGKKTFCVSSLATYHWNHGQGATAGSIGLKVVSGLGGAGNVLGPLAATGSPVRTAARTRTGRRRRRSRS